MIRKYGPTILIPAAWLMTLATLVYPMIDTYWIQHMHYFMLLFLSGFALLSWREMDDNNVLDTWRKTIAIGVIFTGLGAASFLETEFSGLMAWSSITYWFLAPGFALYDSRRFMDEYAELYEKLGAGCIISFLVFITGVYISSLALQGISLVSVAFFQTLSIIKAVELNT